MRRTFLSIAVTAALAATPLQSAFAFTFESEGGGSRPSASDRGSAKMAPDGKLDLDTHVQPQFGVQENPSFDSGPVPQWDKFNAYSTPLRRGIGGGGW